MNFAKPDFVEIKMDAEISSYQESEDPVRDPLFAERAQPSSLAASPSLDD